MLAFPGAMLVVAIDFLRGEPAEQSSWPALLCLFVAVAAPYAVLTNLVTRVDWDHHGITVHYCLGAEAEYAWRDLAAIRRPSWWNKCGPALIPAQGDSISLLGAGSGLAGLFEAFIVHGTGSRRDQRSDPT